MFTLVLVSEFFISRFVSFSSVSLLPFSQLLHIFFLMYLVCLLSINSHIRMSGYAAAPAAGVSAVVLAIAQRGNDALHSTLIPD